MVLDRQSDPDEAVRGAWAAAVRPLALHLAWVATGLGGQRPVRAACRRSDTDRPCTTSDPVLCTAAVLPQLMQLLQMTGVRKRVWSALVVS